MLKRKEFILGAAVSLTLAAAATAGGVIQWPTAEAATASNRLVPNAGAAGLAFAPPQGAPLSFADIFQQVAPAVVQIDVKTRVQRPRGGLTIPGFPFFAVPEGQGRGGAEPETQLAPGTGSGFFITADGYIVTNNHVVEGADAIEVGLADGRKAAAKIVGTDPETDLAVIRIKERDLPVMVLGQPDEARVGDVVLAIGNPFGVGQTVTMGIISAVGRNNLHINHFENFIQTDAAINFGNSGGALVDTHGNLLGINSAIYSQTGGSIGIGFAIPVSTARTVLESIIKHGQVVRGWIGIESQDITPELATSFGLGRQSGAIIAGVVRNGPADRAGVRPGDILLAVEGKPVANTGEMLNLVAQLEPGAKAKLKLMRENRESTVDVTVGKRPRQRQ